MSEVEQLENLDYSTVSLGNQILEGHRNCSLKSAVVGSMIGSLKCIMRIPHHRGQCHNREDVCLDEEPYECEPEPEPELP